MISGLGVEVKGTDSSKCVTGGGLIGVTDVWNGTFFFRKVSSIDVSFNNMFLLCHIHIIHFIWMWSPAK